MRTSTCAGVSDLEATASGVWSRAAALGSLWAAFEIVVGSFLHNLRLPFAGTLLAALSVLLMTAAVQVWPQRGLVWRAALICALMKSISPSAVILNPMIGIFVEGLIMQAALGLLGRGLPGCALGGMAAVSFTLLQKIVSLLITYGTDIVRLYEASISYAGKAASWQRLEPLDLIFAVLGAQAVLGLIAGTAGWRMGRKVKFASAELPLRAEAPARQGQAGAASTGVQPSLVMLAALVVALPAGFWLLSVQPLALSAPILLAASAGAIVRYRASLGKLRKPKLWIELGVVLLLSALMLGAAQGNPYAGLRAGATMLLRALFVIVFFSSISAELKNPVILKRLSRGRLARATAAVQAAFSALPDFIAAMPDLREAFRRPAVTLAAMFRRVDYWHSRLGPAPVILLTGAKGQGKSSLCAEVARLAGQRGLRVAGVLSIGHWDNGTRSGYQVRDLFTGETRWLARRSQQGGQLRYGQFSFEPEGFELGRRALAAGAVRGAELLIVDEVGPLELRGLGWARELDWLHQQRPCPMIWVVRPSLLEPVQRRWPGLTGAMVAWAPAASAQQLLDLLLAERAAGG